MALTETQRVLLETNAARDRAEALLQTLLEAKADCEKAQAETRRNDPFKDITGRSAIDNAIAATRRMIESLERALRRSQRAVNDDALALGARSD